MLKTSERIDHRSISAFIIYTTSELDDIVAMKIVKKRWFSSGSINFLSRDNTELIVSQDQVDLSDIEWLNIDGDKVNVRLEEIARCSGGGGFYETSSPSIDWKLSISGPQAIISKWRKAIFMSSDKERAVAVQLDSQLTCKFG